MGDVTMIGLGSMGGALARALCKGGHQVTVWNRSPDRMRPFEELGARAATNLSDAVQASPAVIVCIADYAGTRDLLAAPDVAPLLRDRTVVQLSTGTSAEAREAEAWVAALGADYLDGALMPYPDGIGRSDAQILVAGAGPAFRRCKEFLDCFGGDIRYLGANIAAAATLDMALLTHQICEAIAVMHGALLCEGEGVGVDVLAAMFPPHGEAGATLECIRTGQYDEPGATLAVWYEALKRIRQLGSAAGVASEVPDFIAGLFDRALAAGYGEQDLAAIFKVLKAAAPQR